MSVRTPSQIRFRRIVGVLSVGVLTLFMLFQLFNCRGEECMAPPVLSFLGYFIFTLLQQALPIAIPSWGAIAIIALLNTPLYYLLGWMLGDLLLDLVSFSNRQKK